VSNTDNSCAGKQGLSFVVKEFHLFSLERKGCEDRDLWQKERHLMWKEWREK